MNNTFFFYSPELLALVVVFLCLGLGYLIGKIKIKSFSLGATAATLIVALTASLLAKQHQLIIPGLDTLGNLRDCFFAMFVFTLGYDVGPAFFKALRSSGVRILALAVIHAACAGALIGLTCVLSGFQHGEGLGFLAGAFTFSAASDLASSAQIDQIYALTYPVGTICAILFVRYLAPKLLGIDLLKATKQHLDSAKGTPVSAISDDCGTLQVRALQIASGSFCDGKTVDQVEAHHHFRLEIEAITRNAQRLHARQAEFLHAGDILTVIGDVSILNRFDDLGLNEVTDPRYFHIRQRAAQVVLTTSVDEVIRERLTNYGIIVRSVTRNGKLMKAHSGIDLLEGDVLDIYGPEKAVEEAAKTLGYLKDSGITTDIPFFALALAAGLLIAGISLPLIGKLGTSFGVLLIGLLAGWGYDRSPRFGHIADSTRWFIKSIGLNLFIAVKGLTSTLTLDKLIDPKSLLYIAVGAALAILARSIVLLIGKHVLKINDVDLLGGLCGSATSTPALNELTDYTGSSVYASSYAPGYALGNVVLMLTGLALNQLLPVH